MPVNYNNAAANARLAAGLTAAVAGQSVDGGAGFGQLVIGTSSLSGATGVLATQTLQKPCGTIASTVWTLAGVPFNVTPSASGTAALGELRDSTGLTIVSGLTVGTTGTDIIVSTVTVSTSIPIQVTAGTITHP